MVSEKNIFGLKVLTSHHKTIRKLKRQCQTSSHHGNKFWKSSLLLMDYFSEMPLDTSRQPLNVLEIGCGWGLTGIWLAKNFDAQVTALDLDDSVFPYLNAHAEINEVSVKTWKKSYDKLTRRELEPFDLIVGGDICFWDYLNPLLYNLIQRAVKAGARCVFSDPGRPPFTTMALKAAEKNDAFLDYWFVPHPHSTSGYILDVPSS